MNVWIARDGEIIGEYPQEDIWKFARSGHLVREDYYWCEGMGDWKPLEDLLGRGIWEEALAPPAPEPVFVPGKRLYLIVAGALGLFVVAIALGIFALQWSFRTSVDDVRTPMQTPPVAPPAPTPFDSAARARAVEELNGRMKSLPAAFAPAAHSYYQGVSLAVSEAPAPLTATITGTEETFDTSNQAPTFHIAFVLSAEYSDGAWWFGGLRAYATSAADNSVLEFRSPADTESIPDLARMLGLRPRRPPIAADSESRKSVDINLWKKN